MDNNLQSLDSSDFYLKRNDQLEEVIFKNGIKVNKIIDNKAKIEYTTTASEILKRLKKNWFEQISQDWSHIKLRKVVDGKVYQTIVPIHTWDCRYGTFRKILTLAWISLQEWHKL